MSLIFRPTILVVFHFYDFLSKIVIKSISLLHRFCSKLYGNIRACETDLYDDPTFLSNNNNNESIKSSKHSANYSANQHKVKLGLEDVPGPFNLPFFGSSWLYTWFGPYTHKKYHESNDDKFLRYGPVVREKVLFTTIIHLFSKDDINKVLNHK